jgi:hypothetical protein
MSSYFDGKQLFQAPTIEQHSSHMVMSNVYKDDKVSYLTIDTTFSTNTDLINNMGVFNIELMAPITEVKSIEVVSANIPLSWYNISEQLQNSFFKYNGDFYKLSDGEYSEKTLIAAINSIINNSSPCSIGPNTGKVSFSSVEHLEFDIDKYGNKDKFNFKSKLGYLLGFREPEYKLDTNDTVNSEKIIDIDKKYDVFISLEDYTTGYTNNYGLSKLDVTSKSNVIAKLDATPPYNRTYGIDDNASVTLQQMKYRINMNEESGNLISGTRHYSGKTNLQKFKVYLADKFSNILDLNGLDFNFTLKIVTL